MPTQCLNGWKQLVIQNVCQNLSIFFVVLTVALAFPFTQAQGSEWGDLPAIKGLDFSNVEISTLIVVHTYDARQDTTQLHAHTIARLAAHKLFGISRDPKDPKQLKRPRLLLTLLAKEIRDCPDKLLYVRNIELREQAVRERQPRVYMDGITYGGADLLPEVIDVSTASRERFEKDLDQMIDSFAQHYWEWNGRNSASQ